MLDDPGNEKRRNTLITCIKRRKELRNSRLQLLEDDAGVDKPNDLASSASRSVLMLDEVADTMAVMTALDISPDE